MLHGHRAMIAALLARDAVRMPAHGSAHFDALTRKVATRFRAKGRTAEMEEDGP